jgi:hypothetical protein
MDPETIGWVIVYSSTSQETPERGKQSGENSILRIPRISHNVSAFVTR